MYKYIHKFEEVLFYLLIFDLNYLLSAEITERFSGWWMRSVRSGQERK